jgi:DNA mismatch repair ATPase MutS
MYTAQHFRDLVGRDGLRFDYQLRPGPATTRNAIALLQLHGAPERLIQRARTAAELLDRQRGTTLSGR